MTHLFYAIKEAHDADGVPTGYYVSIHEHEEQPAVWQGTTFPTIEEADVDFHRDRGCRVNWQEPSEDAAPDVRAVAQD